MLDAASWRERDAEDSGVGGGADGNVKREELMGEKERELEIVRRAEEEARSGTVQRDIGIGGSFGRNGNGGGAEMPVDGEVRGALGELKEKQGGLVQLVCLRSWGIGVVG